MKTRTKAIIITLLIGFLLTLLGHFTINENGGFENITSYCWYWVVCISITTLIALGPVSVETRDL